MNLNTITTLFLAFLTSGFLIANDAGYKEAEKIGADHGREALQSSAPEILEADLEKILSRLTSKQFSGRLTGEPGERMATSYLAEFFKGLGLEPGARNDSFFEKFPYRSKMTLSGKNSMVIIEAGQTEKNFNSGEHYYPLPFSPSGKVDTKIVFAGFGIEDEDQEYNSFEGLDIEGKWLLVFRGHPESRPKLKRYAPLFRKTLLAKQKGAAGIIFIKAKNPKVGSELIAPSNSRASSKPLLPALTITDKLAETLFKSTGEKKGMLKELFDSYNKGDKSVGFALDHEVIVEINLKSQNDPGSNVLARLMAGEEPSDQVVIIGGHIDHLGRGEQGGSRAGGDLATKLHPGADDNASGIAVIMEIAQQLVAQKKAGKLKLKHDIIFAGWSGEELGLWGSRHYVKEARARNEKQIYPKITTYINLDMVGRLTDAGLQLRGIDSSYDFRDLLDRLPAVEGLDVNQIATPYVPSDSEPFFYAGVPILSASTGLHDDYHTPDDTYEEINFPGLLKITNYIKRLLVEVANRPEAPSFVQVPRQLSKEQAGMEKKLGVRVEPANKDDSGVKIAEVFKASRAAKAGFKTGDVVTRFDNQRLANIEDFHKAADQAKPGGAYPYTLKRGKKKINATLEMGERLVPFGSFSFNLDLSAPKGEIELTMFMSRKEIGSNGEVEFGARCIKFPAGQRSISDEEFEALSKACHASKRQRGFEEIIESNTYRGVVDTVYQSVKQDKGWQVVVQRGETKLEISPEERTHLSTAYRQYQAAKAWYTGLLSDEETSPSRRMRPPSSDSYSLSVDVGKEMAENKDIGFKISIDNLNDENEPRIGYSLMLGLSSNQGDWVEELYQEIGKALDAAEAGEAYSNSDIGNATITANPENKAVDVVVSVLNRDDRISSFNRKDYNRVGKVISKSERWLEWILQHESWFHTKP